jgi:ATP synthase F1 complex assembly factor 1
LFLYPVFRESGYMTLVSQFQDSCFLLTFLDEYRQNPGAAKPWMSLTLYDEFVADKGLGLLRGDVGYQLTREVGQGV